MRCLKCRDLLEQPGARAGELSPTLAAHLRTCRACARYAEQFAQFREAAERHWSAGTDDPWFARSVLSRIEATQRASVFPQVGLRLASIPAVAALLFILLSPAAPGLAMSDEDPIEATVSWMLAGVADGGLP